MPNVKDSQRAMKTLPRRLRKIGGSLNLTLPPEFVRENDLKDGQDVVVVWNGRNLKLILPEP